MAWSCLSCSFLPHPPLTPLHFTPVPPLLHTPPFTFTGDLERIKTVGQYLIQVWTAAGMDMTRVKFLWSSEEICKHALPYWTQALDIGRKFSVARIMKCCQIMGRKEGTLTAAQILYPIMQCTDIFFLKADVCQLGVDQRKASMPPPLTLALALALALGPGPSPSPGPGPSPSPGPGPGPGPSPTPGPSPDLSPVTSPKPPPKPERR